MVVTCGHQLGSSDYSSWLLSSSATAPIVGSTATADLLQTIILDDRLDSDSATKSTEKPPPSSREFFQSRRIHLSVAKEREEKYQNQKQSRITNRRRKIDCFHDFSGFQEDEHLDGCPVKWLFRRQSNESVKSGKSKTKVGDEKKIRKTVIRDMTPREIQIKKMGLKKRETKPKSTKEEQEVDKEIEKNKVDKIKVSKIRRISRNPLLEEEDEDEKDDHDCGKMCLSNFLRPRPLTGQRMPWLYVLLAPRLDITVKKHHSQKKERTKSPTMSVRSLVLPDMTQTKPKTTSRLPNSAARWASPKAKTMKTIRHPDLNWLDQRKPVPSPSPTTEDSVYPTLLMEEDKYFRLRRFLNLDKDPVLMGKGEVYGCKNRGEQNAVIELVSSRVQFFERPGKPMR